MPTWWCYCYILLILCTGWYIPALKGIYVYTINRELQTQPTDHKIGAMYRNTQQHQKIKERSSFFGRKKKDHPNRRLLLQREVVIVLYMWHWRSTPRRQMTPPSVSAHYGQLRSAKNNATTNPCNDGAPNDALTLYTTPADSSLMLIRRRCCIEDKREQNNGELVLLPRLL